MAREVKVKIEGLDPQGKVVKLARGEDRSVIPGDKDAIEIVQGTISLDLVEARDHEVVVIALYDSMAHALVSFDAEVVRVEGAKPFDQTDYSQIRACPLKIGQPVEIYRHPCTNLQLSHPQIAGFRLTRVS